MEEAGSTAAFSPEHHKLLWRLYISHALSTWGDRMWAFSVSLFFIEIWPESVRESEYDFHLDLAHTLAA